LSGGLWDYKDMHLTEQVDPDKIPVILKAVEEALHAIDWCESGDTGHDTADKKVYDIMHQLGNDLYAEYVD